MCTGGGMEFEYRSIKYEKTEKGFWLFRSFLPGSALRWSHWYRFLTDEEIENTDDAAMKKAIDRAYDDSPVYTGDLRYRRCV